MSKALGAYGFALEGVGDAAELLNEVPESWPTLAVSQMLEKPMIGGAVIGEDQASMPLLPTGHLALTRSPRTATYTLESPLGVDAIVHPYLAPAAAIHAAWMGWETYHAAGVVIAGSVWGIAGSREVGKSTLVAALAARGLAVMADDLLVLQGESAVIGPRSIDLRSQPDGRLGEARELGTTGMRERWRIAVGPAPVTAPFAGWIYPEWTEATTLSAPPLAERLTRPNENRAAAVNEPDPAHTMWMARLPAVSFGRPKDWDTFDDSLDQLLAAIS